MNSLTSMDHEHNDIQPASALSSARLESPVSTLGKHDLPLYEGKRPVSISCFERNVPSLSDEVIQAQPKKLRHWTIQHKKTIATILGPYLLCENLRILIV